MYSSSSQEDVRKVLRMRNWTIWNNLVRTNVTIPAAGDLPGEVSIIACWISTLSNLSGTPPTL